MPKVTEDELARLMESGEDGLRSRPLRRERKKRRREQLSGRDLRRVQRRIVERAREED